VSGRIDFSNLRETLTAAADHLEALEQLTDRQVERNGKLTGQIHSLILECNKYKAALEKIAKGRRLPPMPIAIARTALEANLPG